MKEKNMKEIKNREKEREKDKNQDGRKEGCKMEEYKDGGK